MDKYTYHIPEVCNEPVKIVKADSHVVVVDKPSGLLSVPGRIIKDCVLNRVVFDYPDAVVVHRLDLDTSGLLVLALSKLATSDLNRQFRERLVVKEYQAEVYGIVEQDKGEISLPMAPDPINRPRQVIDFKKGKAALTRFEVIQRRENSTRLCLKPETGRSHQLRIHLASIGHPVLGCDLYAHEDALGAASRLCLHASFLGFFHPESREMKEFTSEAPF